MLNKLIKIRHRLSPNLLKIIHNIGWLSGEKLLRMVVSLSIGVYVIRYLGSDNFGKLSYCASLVGMFSVIAKLGLDNIVVRNLVKEEKSKNEILGTAFTLKLISSVITIFLITYVAFIVTEDSQISWIIIVIALGLVFNSFDVIDFWFQSQVKSRAIAIIRSVQLILSSIVKLIFIFLGYSLAPFIWLLMLESLFRAVCMIWVYCQQSRSIFFWKFNFTRAIDMLRDSYPLILSGAMITIYMKVDQIMLGNMANSEAVGNYAAAVRFSEIWYFVPIAICSSVFPAIIRAKQRSKKEYYGKLQQLYDLMAWISLVIAITMTFLSSTLMTNLLGSNYQEAGKILALHIWAGPFVFLGVARSKWLTAENMTQFNFFTTALGTAVNLGLNFILIPNYGGVGAAIATVVSYAVASHFSCIIYPKMFNTGLMLTKALFIPFRIRQNLLYINKFKDTLS